MIEKGVVTWTSNSAFFDFSFSITSGMPLREEREGKVESMNGLGSEVEDRREEVWCMW